MGNAMRYMLTGEHWGAQEAYRMGVIQQIAANPAQALEAGIGLAEKIAACGPLGIKTTLESAHLSIDESEAAAFAKLDGQFGGLAGGVPGRESRAVTARNAWASMDRVTCRYQARYLRTW